VRTGWRRDEWAYSPLFIWGKTSGFAQSTLQAFNPFKIICFSWNFGTGPRHGLHGTGSGGSREQFPAYKDRTWRLMTVRLDEIRSAAERVAASHGLEIVSVEFVGPAKERVLRVYLEKNAEGRAKLKAAIEAGGDTQLPERLAEGKLSVEQLSGVTHEDCAEFSRDFGVLLDVEDLVPGAEYTLEASSPGLDRKLTKPQDFERFRGCLVKVQTFEPLKNNRHWQGRLIAGPEGGAGQTITVDLNAVKQNSKSRKAGVSAIEIALTNIEKAQLVPEI
jgi:Uncharacterized protein conserved in bacteria